MSEYAITEKDINRFETHLSEGEYAPGTIEKYLRDVRRFYLWINGRQLTKAEVTAWKSNLIAGGYVPSTINAMLVAVNQFLKFMGCGECCVKELRIQKRLFRSTERELTKTEYERLISAAEKHGRERLALLMETICATGIRVSEVKNITVEAVGQGCAEIALKGKIRTVLLPNKLCRKLRKYAQKQKITSGEIFLTRSGKGISRRQIWAEMKSVCKAAGVAETKVFPHNLRHLFARRFYQVCKDIAKLADVLGHSSIETTRIYLVSTGEAHLRLLSRLGLIC